MNKARAMLDALMGPQRDTKKDENSEDWKDKTICKGFLIGFCPLDKGVLGGKRTMDVCEKIHSEVIRAQFAEHKDGQEGSELLIKYEEYSIRDLEFAVAECEAYGRREVERLRKEPRSKALPQDVNQKISQMKRESTALAQKAAALDDQEHRQKESLMKESEDIANQVKTYEKDEEAKVAANFRPLACEICGTAYLSQNAGEYETHLKYKIHESYTLVRNRLKELKDKKAERERVVKEKKEAERKKKDEERAKKAEEKEKKRKEKDEDKEKRKDKDKDEKDDSDDDKEKDKDKEKEKDREKDKDKEKKKKDKEKDDSDDEKEKEKEKSKKDKDKDKKDKDRDRSGDRDRRRSRSRGRDKARRDRSRSRDRAKGKKDRRDRSRSRSRSRDRRRR
mmetsp:Transcript_51122/g.91831  ORF Transcript_51122/g.91831 Transcript_51122/m.91831 type:complete len:393 (-) Transcript_51122:52-1230(-)